MGHRKYFKSEAFLKQPEVQQMQEEHKKAFGTAISPQGYPDMGNGRYSQYMPYKEWVAFNNAQHSHYNMIEISAPSESKLDHSCDTTTRQCYNAELMSCLLAFACLLGAGLYFPRTSAALGATFGLGRILYAIGYNTSKGAEGRLLGVIIAEVAVIGLFGASFYAGALQTGLASTVRGYLGL